MTAWMRAPAFAPCWSHLDARGFTMPPDGRRKNARDERRFMWAALRPHERPTGTWPRCTTAARAMRPDGRGLAARVAERRHRPAAVKAIGDAPSRAGDEQHLDVLAAGHLRMRGVESVAPFPLRHESPC